MKKRADMTGFNTGKSLTDCINDVMKSKNSVRTKRNDLIKLGLKAGDIEYIFSKFVAKETKGDFDFSKLTFGIEIECYNVERTRLIEEGSAQGLNIRSCGYTHAHTEYYKIASDSSIAGINPNEVVTPVLKGKRGMSSLKKLCKSLEAVDAKVNRSCGLHVHIGAQYITDEHYIRIFSNYQHIERAIDSFMPQSRRDNNNDYCHTLITHNFSGCHTKRDVMRELGFDRYHKVNAEAYAAHKTIEFRQHSGTVSYDKINHWVLFLAKLVEYSFKNEIKETIFDIESIPFLTDKEKEYFINRRATLN